jgi:hypothetical protein
MNILAYAQYALYVDKGNAMKLIAKGAIKINPNKTGVMKVKKEQLDEIAQVIYYDKFIQKYSIIAGKTILIQNRYAVADDLIIGLLKRDLQIKEVYVMITDKPLIKGGLDEVLMQGEIFKINKGVTIDYIQNDIQVKIDQIDLNKIWSVIVTFKNGFIIVNNEYFTLEYLISQYYLYDSEITEDTFKIVVMSNIKLYQLLDKFNYRYTPTIMTVNGFEDKIKTPYETIGLRQLYQSKVFGLLYIIFKKMLGIRNNYPEYRAKQRVKQYKEERNYVD